MNRQDIEELTLDQWQHHRSFADTMLGVKDG